MLPKPEDIKTLQKGIILVSLPLVIGSLFLALMWGMILSAQEQAQSEAHLKRILFAQNKLHFLLSDSMALSIATNAVWDKSDSNRMRMMQLTEDIDAQLKVLDEYVKDDPSLKRQTDQMKKEVYTFLSVLRSLRMSAFDSSQIKPFEMPKMIRRARTAITRHQDHRQVFSREIQSRQRPALVTADQWGIIIVSVLSLGLISSVGFSILGVMFFGGNMSRRLNVILQNSVLFAANQPINPPVGGQDEIADLDSMFHIMTAKLERERRKEKAITDNALEVICTIDSATKFTTMNPASARAWQYGPEELLGRYMADIIFKDDIESTQEAMRSCQSQQKDTVFENRIKRRDGSLITMLWSIYWSSPQKLFFCVAHDITKRRLQEELLQESEAQVRLILDSMPVGLVISNENEKIDMANQTMEALLRLDAGKLIGAPVRSLLPDSIPSTNEQFTTGIQELVSGETKEITTRRSDGSEFPAQLVASDFYFHGQRKLLLVVCDNTVRHDAEKLKQELVAMVTHDLRAPLTTLVVTCQLFKGGTLGELSEKGKSKVQTMEKEAERLLGLINDLLDLEKLEIAGGMDIKREIVSMETVIEQAVSSVGYLAEKNGMAVVCDVEPCEAVADGGRLVQVIVNLLANAIKFS
ncbi:MAG: PAS domain-containing sensor histidine kinase, partial [Cyanobacteria bacterium]|nr:PAS domain-containing sensor histidine kinase [Cyanobacteriota bacterium]